MDLWFKSQDARRREESGAPPLQQQPCCTDFCCCCPCNKQEEELDNFEKAQRIQRRATRITMTCMVVLAVVISVVFRYAYFEAIASFSYEQYDMIVVTLHDIHYCTEFVKNDEWKQCPTNHNTSYNFTAQFECQNMDDRITATNVFMLTAYYAYIAIIVMYDTFILLSVIQALIFSRKFCCRAVTIFFKRISSFLTAVMTLLLCLVPVFTALLSVPAFLTIGLSMSRLCREANSGAFVRPLYERRNFNLGVGSKLVIAGAVLCWVVTIAAIVVLAKARKEAVALTVSGLTGDEFEDLMSTEDDDEQHPIRYNELSSAPGSPISSSSSPPPPAVISSTATFADVKPVEMQ
jgi:hypothetical protein